MSIEALGSLGVGLLAGSFALLAFGGDSLVELLSALVVTRHLKEDAGGSQTPGLKTAWLGSVLLLSLLPIVGFGAGYSFLSGLRPESSPLGIAIAVVAVVVMPYLWVEKRRIGGETRCLPLQIDALESATCFLMSLALLGGLTAEFFLGVWWADYVATGLILTVVAREGFESLYQAKLERHHDGRPLGQSSMSPERFPLG
jgi:divalent metal cation (Fe/Co/Zn/Cd) transporter